MIKVILEPPNDNSNKTCMSVICPVCATRYVSYYKVPTKCGGCEKPFPPLFDLISEHDIKPMYNLKGSIVNYHRNRQKELIIL